MAILLTSIGGQQSAFALSAADELAQGAGNDFDPSAQPQSASSVFNPSQTNVNTEMQLLMDVSSSVDNAEFLLQRGGYEAAFRDPDVIDALSVGCPNTPAKGLAVSFVYWSGGAEQQVAVPFSFLNDATSSNLFADAIASAARPFSGLTGPGSAINFAVPLFTNAFDGDKIVIDVSGDGTKNSGVDTSDARDAALAGVVDVINGIVISPNPTVVDFYKDNIIGGQGSFLLEALTFADFEEAIEKKILLEICPGNGVGGEFLSINTTALILAGAQTNAVWIMSALAAIGSVAFGALYLKTRKN